MNLENGLDENVHVVKITLTLVEKFACDNGKNWDGLS